MGAIYSKNKREENVKVFFSFLFLISDEYYPDKYYK